MCAYLSQIATSKEEVEAYQTWWKADDMAWCYILASMSNVLQHQHEHMATAYDMMINFKEMFGDQKHAGRQVAMKALLMRTSSVPVLADNLVHAQDIATSSSEAR